MTVSLEKKVYHIRHLGGRYFSEAYLVLRDSVSGDSAPADTLAEEADRIIREAGAVSDFRSSRAVRRVRSLLLFLAGGATSAAVIYAVLRFFPPL